MNRILVFLVIAEALLLVCMAQHITHRQERIRLLEAHMSVCTEYVKLSEHQTRSESVLRAGYARIVQQFLKRLGLPGIVPGADDELLNSTLLKKRPQVMEIPTKYKGIFEQAPEKVEAADDE